MKHFVLTVDGVEYPIEVSEDALMINGRTFRVQTNKHEVVVNGVEYQVELGESIAWVNGFPYSFSLGDGCDALAQLVQLMAQDDAAAMALSQPAMQSNHALTAVMPGRVLRVLVKEGDDVQVGDVLCVLEAMKMENELRAQAAGTVQQVLVKPGQSVKAGELLILFEEAACLSSEA
nr:biotin/lipoyl-binding protein [Chloroflexota bacterium]